MMNTCSHFYLHLTNMFFSDRLQMTNSSYTEVPLKNNIQSQKIAFLGTLFLFVFFLPPHNTIPAGARLANSTLRNILKYSPERGYIPQTFWSLAQNDIYPLWSFPSLLVHLWGCRHKKSLSRRGVLLCLSFPGTTALSAFQHFCYMII